MRAPSGVRSPISAQTFAACIWLGLAACGDSSDPNASDPEDGVIVAAYLAAHPDLLTTHGHWHIESLRGSPTYGADFLAFHRELIEGHDAWRAANGYGPVPAWNPSTAIPAAARHPGRITNHPSAVDALCKTPDWLKLDGAGDRNPDFGAGRLADFTSADQLGRAVDSLNRPNWHSRVHATIGGDLANVHSFPRDPVFWRFHKFIDEIWRQWERASAAAATP